MASWQARMATWIVRRRLKPLLSDMKDVARVRVAFGNATLPVPKGARITPGSLGGVPGEWVEPIKGGAGATLLYIHGGAFIGCSPRTHRPITASLALRGLRVFVPDYRLAPEHPFPAGLDDVVAAWRALRADAEARGDTRRLVVAGDSAGGNLALGLMLTLKDAGEALPAAAALFSPSTDFTGSGASLTENAERDAMFRPEALQDVIAHYLQGADPAQPRVSPLLGDLAGLPPLLVHVSADEMLRDDGVRVAEKARAAGVPVELKAFDGVAHVWQMVFRLPEARASIAAASRFLLEAERPVVAPAAAALPVVSSPAPVAETVDVLIVGAGLSGIGAAAHLQQHFPARRYLILEGREAIGGTWDLFRYPGIRSDSDMYTLGYIFKPWRNAKAIADGPSIRQYVTETANERGIAPHIRYQHHVVAANWSSAEGRWLVDIERGPQRERVRIATNFLWMCSGYYSYAEGHRPHFPGEERFQGTLVHPQFWPEGLDHAGKRVVVIGSGATAVTLVPEMAHSAAHVTMLQRSPTYVVSRPGIDPIAEWLKRKLPPMWAYRLTRLKNVFLGMFFFRLARARPERVKQRLLEMVKAQLPAGYDVQKHFTPHYNPWDQRVCLVPDGDMFTAIREGRASVVTDTIETFTERGIRLGSGEELQADIVVTATGLKLLQLGGVAISVDGRPVPPAQTMVYKGMMYSDVPNLVSTFGYTNASWTLKADLTANYVCRLLDHMDRHGMTVAVPRRDPSVAVRPFLDFSSNYVLRAADHLPKQGDRRPWRLYQNYLLDLITLRHGRIDDGTMQFSRVTPPAAEVLAPEMAKAA